MSSRQDRHHTRCFDIARRYNEHRGYNAIRYSPDYDDFVPWEWHKGEWIDEVEIADFWAWSDKQGLSHHDDRPHSRCLSDDAYDLGILEEYVDGDRLLEDDYSEESMP